MNNSTSNELFFFSFSTISLAQLGQENAHSEDLFVADD